MSREFSLLILVTPNSTMIGHRDYFNIIYITELQNKPNVALHNLKGFSGLFALNLYLSYQHFQRLSDQCKFHNKPHASKGVYL